MKKTWMIILGLGLLVMSSCVKEEVYVYRELPQADVLFEFWSGPSGTWVEGEIYNDGNTYINAVELEVRLYDHRGFVIETDWYWINTYSYPGEASGFTLDLWEPYVYDVSVRVTGFD